MKFRSDFLLLVMVVLAASIVGVPNSADAARRDSLGGNLLIDDRDDVYIWPQLAVVHSNLVAFEYGADAGAGNGLLIWEQDFGALGVAVHRGDLFSNHRFPYQSGLQALGDVSSPLGDTYAANSGTTVDLFAGFDLDKSLLGARLAIGGGGTSTTPPDNPDAETSNSELFFVFQAGFSRSARLSVDTALEISYAGGSNEVGDDTPRESSNFGIDFNGRGYLDTSEPFELGMLADLSFNSTSTDTLQADDSTTTNDQSTFAGQIGAGPVWTLDGQDNDTTIAGYGVVSYVSQSADPNTDQDDDASGLSQVIVPGFHIAADIQLLDWLYFRSGAQYSWAVLSSSRETPDGDAETSSKGSQGPAVKDPTTMVPPTPGGFGWDAGVGIEVDNFRFDGSFSDSFLVDGPNFIGGGNGFLAMASAEYAW